jgi:cytochrome b6-f complex iron-sulfur subunit
MATKELVTKVWIDPGCIVCDACETACPEVFEVQEETCIVRPEALNTEFTKPLTASIIEAAEECPVDVIKFETTAGEVSASEVSEQQAPQPVAASADATEPDAATAALGKKKSSPEVPESPQDPALAALLKAVTARGGREGITASSTNPLNALNNLGKKRFDDLPPDARFVKTLESAKSAKKSAAAADEVSRREFVNSAALACGWTFLGGTLFVASGPAFGRFMMPNVLEEPPTKIRVGSVDKYAAMSPGEVNEDIKPSGIWLIRLEDRVAALSTTCTHLGCIPNWLESDRKFKCPCHGSGFKQDGINFEGPAPRPLERLKISEIDGEIIVDKSVKFLQEQGQWGSPDSFLLV